MRWESNNNLISDNIVLNNREGINIGGSNNNIINNSIISNNGYGIYVGWNSDNNIISNNIISNNTISNSWGINGGISLCDSSNNKITSNIFTNNGITIYGYELRHWIHTIENNTVNGKPLYYLRNKVGGSISDAGQVILVGCRDIVVENLNISNTDIGITISYSSNITVRNNILSNNNNGSIYLLNTNYSYITGNDIIGNGQGITLDISCNNIITNNNIKSNDNYGIHLGWDSDNNIIDNNIISHNNGYGIYLGWNSNYNTITNNNIVSNSRYGIELYGSDNTIYLNNFIDNNNYIYPYSHSTNFWNSPEVINYTYNGIEYTNYLGNYWDNYTGYDMDGDGIGDMPHYLTDSNVDNYPLMKPWENYYTFNTLYIQINDSKITVGEEIQVPLKLLNSNGVGGLQVTIYFDESVINITNVTAGDFDTKFDLDFSNISDGILRITCMKEGEDLTGDLVIAHLRIKALSEGISPLKLTADLTTSTGNEVEVSIIDTNIVVNPRIPGDVNNNGEVNIGDAVLLWNWVAFPNDRDIKYIIDKSNADVNGDNIIDIGDATLLWNWVAYPNERGSTYILE